MEGETYTKRKAVISYLQIYLLGCKNWTIKVGLSEGRCDICVSKMVSHTFTDHYITLDKDCSDNS